MEQEMYNCRIGRDYPGRLVDHKKTYKEANRVLWGKKKEPKVREENDRIMKVHVKQRNRRRKRG